MPLRQQVVEDIKQAMKSGDKPKLAALRMLKAAIQTREVELRGERGRDVELDDTEALAVVQRAAKQRRESIDSYRSGGREDLAAKEEAELAVLEGYLPEPLDDAELATIVREVIAETGAQGPKDIGTVMKAAMPRVSGRADGKRVNAVARRLLA